METPEEKAAREAAEDAAATGSFEDDADNTPVLTPPATPAASHEEEDDDDVDAPEGAENPNSVKNLIKAERQAARKANARARELEEKLRELEVQRTTPAEPATPASDGAAEARALRLEIALDKGLSKTLALRLQGATREEMEADADALLAEVGTRRSGPGMDGGYRQDPPPPALKPEQAHNKFITNLLQGARAGRE